MNEKIDKMLLWLGSVIMTVSGIVVLMVVLSIVPITIILILNKIFGGE